MSFQYLEGKKKSKNITERKIILFAIFMIVDYVRHEIHKKRMSFLLVTLDPYIISTSLLNLVYIRI